MPVPKGKSSKSRRDQRQANKFIKPKAIAVCQTCQAPIAPHTACKGCGYYKGEKILRTKMDRAQERGQARREQEEKKKATDGGGSVPEVVSDEKDKK